MEVVGSEKPVWSAAASCSKLSVTFFIGGDSNKFRIPNGLALGHIFFVPDHFTRLENDGQEPLAGKIW